MGEKLAPAAASAATSAASSNGLPQVQLKVLREITAPDPPRGNLIAAASDAVQRLT